MTQHELAHPHDLLTRSILSDPELAASLLEHYVESETIELLDLDRLRCESPVDVDTNLVEVIGDLRYSTVFKNTDRQSNVFVFLEHQSTRDDLMSFRALKQVVNAFQQHIDTAEKNSRQPKSFPFPIVVILYHGKRPWGKLKRMCDMIDSASEFAGGILNFPIFLIDLSRIPPEQLKGHPALQTLLELLQLASVGRLEAGFNGATSRLATVRNDSRAPRWMGAFVNYAISICRVGQDIIYQSFLKILNEKEARKMAMSTMQELMLEGEVRGILKGKKETILRFLEGRFGKVPKIVRDAVNSYSDSTALNSLSEFAGSCKSLDEFKDSLR